MLNVSLFQKARIARAGVILTFIMVLSGCQSSLNVSSQSPDLSGAPVKKTLSVIAPSPSDMVMVVREEEIFALSEQEKERFFNYYLKKLALDEREHHIVSSYIRKHLQDFDYYGDTFIASEGVQGKKGNCMSLAVITSAYAKLLDMKMDYRLVLSQPVYDRSNGLVITSKHVQTRIFEPKKNKKSAKTLGIGAHVIVDYFPDFKQIKGSFIQHNSFVSLFYQNIAGKHLAKGEIDLAYANAYQAFLYDKDSSSALNLLALTSTHKGEQLQAEKIYQYVLEENADDLLALNNYIVLLNKQRRFKEANKYQQALNSLYDPNPYNWIDLAEKQTRQGLLQEALRSYNKAIKLAPYIQEPYIEAYRILQSQKRHVKAQQYLESSLKWVFEPEKRSMIKYKLYGQHL